jgi:uncharacterized protein (TIGR03437 family)
MRWNPIPVLRSRTRLATRMVAAVGVAGLAGAASGLCMSLSIPPAVGSPGASVPASVLIVTNGPAISGLQFDLSFDDSVLSLSSVIGSAARGSGKSLHVAELATNKMRFVIWEFNRNPISDGSIINLFFNVAAGAKPGVYSIHFEGASATDADGQPVPVSTSDGALTLQSTYGAPVVAQGVLNSASVLSGPVAPGELITIIGTAIGAVSTGEGIAFNGFPAPVTYVAADQVNVVVPFEIAGRITTTLTAANRTATAGVSLQVAPSAPGIFTLSGSGTGPGAILNQDLTMNSPGNPAETGSTITIYATGAGQTIPPGIDGLIPTSVLPKPLLKVSVVIGGAAAPIEYAGAAPGQISGILQVNCRVPVQIAAGNSVPVILSVGEAASPPVTVAVKAGLHPLRPKPVSSSVN